MASAESAEGGHDRRVRGLRATLTRLALRVILPRVKK
jgi:hypothetical protein